MYDIGEKLDVKDKERAAAKEIEHRHHQHDQGVIHIWLKLQRWLIIEKYEIWSD